uniref:STAS domain-containing protein n=1 Tax=Steinernema glaseri TaxID=37863 RepID=A0A1I7ZG90_9BILA
MARRKNWTLCIFKCGKEHFGFLANNHEASFQEFARPDPALNQITAIQHEREEYVKEGLFKETKISTEQDIKSLKRRFFSRINYGALHRLTLTIVDDIGLHSAIVNYLVDKNAKIAFLELKYQDAASTELLEGLVQKKVFILCGHALIPQRQLRNFSCYAKMSLRESFSTSLVADWKKDDSPERKQLFFDSALCR